jgi:hypothetical protein
MLDAKFIVCQAHVWLVQTLPPTQPNSEPSGIWVFKHHQSLMVVVDSPPIVSSGVAPPMADAGSSLVTAWSLHVFAPFVSLQSMFHQHIPVLGFQESCHQVNDLWNQKLRLAWTQWMHLEDHVLRRRETLPFLEVG